MEVVNLLSSILVTPVTELCIPALKRQTSYIVHCKKKLKQLEEQVKELKETRNNVNRSVTAAERNNEDIFEIVKAWLEEVEKETNNIDNEALLDVTINSRCWCSCASGSRYNLGKRATIKLVTIEKLLVKGKSFNRNNISEPCVAMSTNPIPTSNLNDFMSFASREVLQDQVMAALQNEGTYLIGVHGMGGVGKTTFVTQVYKQMKNEKNLFDDVVMVKNITKDVKLEKLQNDIAEGLGFEDIKKAGNTLKRAEMLFERLMKKRTLVILDDLWSHLNFSQVGIPCEGICKVIITTRRLEVCTSYDSIVPIKINGLSEVDSWHLFKKMNVDDLAYPPDLEKTAKEIANECGGLPVAIVTLAKGLRKKDMSVWDNTLHQLKNSKIPYHIDEIKPEVFTSIKLSYDFLENKFFQNCFLLCSLFPRAHEIYISDLMPYLIADGNEDEWTLKQMKNEVSTILAKLVDSSLLLREEGSYGSGLSPVSMHDVIRDVAMNIASEEGNGFLIKAGLGLKHWPTKSLSSSTTGNGKCWCRLSLMINEIANLPDDPPELPHLSSLSLCANESLKEIPNCFFERMGSLETLDLRDTGISSLPSSLSFLLNLKTLYLDRCKFIRPTNICVIGMLKKLEILSLAKCRLMGLPEELRGLTNLRLLNVEGNYNSPYFTIPRNVLRSLSRLEYLNTYCCNIKWEFEGCENGSNASLEEVASLNYLSGLDLKLKEDDVNISGGDIHINNDADISTENPKCGHVNKFSIFFSDATGILMMSSYPMVNPLPSNCEVDVSPPVCPSIKVLIQRVEILRVKGGLKSLGQLGDRFNNLKELRVFCKEMEYLVSMEETGTERLFVTLEKLFLDSLYRLKAVFLGWVDRLRDLDIRHCGEIVSIFDSNLGIRSAPNLESLFVGNCGGLKDVFNLKIHQRTSSTSLNIDQEGLSDVVTFSRLKKIALCFLGNLENIWNGCIPFQCFENLEELKVSDCEKLKYLFSPSMARNLQNLKILVIIKCNMVKLISSIDQQMVYDDQEGDVQPLLVIFPNLRILHIKDCENLKQLWEIGNNLEKEDGGGDDQLVGRASILDFPALESLKVFGCENLKRIRLTHRCTEQLKEIKGDNIEWFRRLEWEESSDKPRLQSLFHDLVSVRLESIPEMVQGVCSDNFELQLEFTTQFRKLLSVEGYPSIDDVINAGVVPRFVEFLERLDVPQLQFEAVWILAYITSGTSEHKKVVHDHGAIPKFVQLLSSSDDDVREQAVCALGDVVIDSPTCRDLVLGQGALIPLLSQLNEHSKLSMLRNATRTLSHFCWGVPPPPFEQVKLALPALRHLIHSADDEQVLRDACCALSCLSEGTSYKIQAVIDAGVCPRLVELLHHPSETVVLPALLTVGNIVAGDDAQKQYILDNQVLPCLYQLLTQNHEEIIKTAGCQAIVSITRGNRGQMQIFGETRMHQTTM